MFFVCGYCYYIIIGLIFVYVSYQDEMEMRELEKEILKQEKELDEFLQELKKIDY